MSYNFTIQFQPISLTSLAVLIDNGNIINFEFFFPFSESKSQNSLLFFELFRKIKNPNYPFSFQLKRNLQDIFIYCQYSDYSHTFYKLSIA